MNALPVPQLPDAQSQIEAEKALQEFALAAFVLTGGGEAICTMY
jgi:hypothetical protein